MFRWLVIFAAFVSPLDSTSVGMCDEVFFDKQAELMETYNLEIPVGTGGNAKVYFAHAPKPARTFRGQEIATGDPVLVKIPLTPTEAKFLKVEVRVIEKLANSELAELFVDGYYDAAGALVMPYRQTQLRTLEHYIEQHPRNPLPALRRQDLAAIKSQLETALAEMDHLGITHGDLKLNNVLVDVSVGLKIRVIDFGQSQRGSVRGDRQAVESMLSDLEAAIAD